MLSRAFFTAALLVVIPALASGQQEKAFAKGPAHTAAPDKDAGEAPHNNGNAAHNTAHASHVNANAKANGSHHAAVNSGGAHNAPRSATTTRTVTTARGNGANPHTVTTSHTTGIVREGGPRTESVRTVTRPDGSR